MLLIVLSPSSFSTDLFQSSSVLDYSCNPPIPLILQTPAIHHPANCNLPILECRIPLHHLRRDTIHY